jgi:hypothetical protein
MRSASFMLLTFVPPGKLPKPVAILLFDSENDVLHWRFRDDWHLFAEPEDVEILACMAEDFTFKVQELGPQAFLAHLEDTLSNSVRITDREPIFVDNALAAVDRLFESRVVGR